MGKRDLLKTDTIKPSLKHSRLTSIAALLTLSSLLTLSTAQDHTELTIGQLSRNNRIEQDETKFFKVKVEPKDYDRDKDLIVKVYPEGFYQGDPDVYISRNNKKPNRRENSEWQCSTFGRDTCTISGKEFYSNDIFYIGVRCGSSQDGKCTFQIQPTMKGELLLEEGADTQVDFNENEAKVFRFYIPANSMRGSDASQRIKSVMITAIPLLPVDEKMSLYASTKGSVNPDQTSRKGTPGWRKGQTLRLSDDDNTGEWCTDCYIKILLDVTAAGKYQIMAKTNVGVPTLQKGVKLDDVSFYGERQCYKYFVKDSSTDVNVRFAQYSGIASFSFNPREIPLKFDDAVYRKAEFGNAALIITAKDRAVNATSTGLYYLCVFSHMTATYSIQILEEQPNQKYHKLEDGWDEQGELIGRNLSVYLYKVPALDFKGEDISLEFQLASVSGETPRMYASFCKDSKINLRKCTENISNETILKAPYLQARAVGKGLSIIIDHDEDMCQKVYNNECYYTLVVQGQSKSVGDLSKYSITSMHSQQNYYVLQEGQSINDYVSMGSYRYYSFTIPPPNPQEIKGPKIRNISFQLNSLHGDADIFVSKKHKYPNRMDYEKNSVRTTDSFDLVYFDDSNGNSDLTGTYYLGVYSYQYSTYSLVANVERVNKEGKIISYLGLNPDEGKKGISLLEGVQVTGRMQNLEHTILYRLDVKQLEGYEKAIKIQLSPIENNFKIFAKFDSPPHKDLKKNEATWHTDDHHLTIRPKDPNFKREGTLYILVIPRPMFLERLDLWKAYSFMISYTTEDSYFYLKSQISQELKQHVNTYDYFRHFVGTFNKDISLSLTVFSGNPVLFASFNPDHKWPISTTQGVISTQGQATMVGGGGKGKALFFQTQRIQSQNRACASAVEDSIDPCVLFASVYCEGASDKDECRYAIKLTYESSAPQPLIVGQPQHNVLKDGTYHYYYMILKEQNIQEGQNIMGVLQSIKGNTDLYVGFKDTPQSSNPDTWELPTMNEYAYKSTQVGINNQDMVKINAQQDKNLQECFARFNNRYGTEKECAIIFGIYSASPNQMEKDLSSPEQLSSRYNFVVFMDLQQLMSQAPVTSFVDKGEFQYYQFESTCVDCTILISLSTVGNGDPDLYVNFGESRGFPSREESHMQSSTFKSEMITINLNHPFFKANNLKSMKGSFIIGVYGAKRSNYTLVVSQDKHPIQMLTDNTATKTSQEPFEIVYFTWYNMQHDNGKAKDFKLSLSVKNGQADIYMSTYIEDDKAKNSEQHNLIARLPKSKRDAQWVVENINSKSTASQRELVVLNNERLYCTQCFYLIGIVTHDQKTDYSLQIDLFDANFNTAQILKLGESYETVFKTEIDDRRRVYRFMIDEDAPLQFVQTVKNTKVMTVVSFSESEENPVLVIHDTDAVQLAPDDKNFQIGRMYYIIVKELQAAQNATHSIMLMQNRTILRLADGLPMTMKYQGSKDVSKLMIFTIPDGSYTFTVQVKTKTENFYPRLYVKYYADIESQWRELEFPPAGEPNYFICKNWDYKMGVLNYEEKFEDIKGGKAGLALNLLESSNARESIEDAEVIITVSATPVIKMVEGQTYIGNLAHTSNYKIYQVDELLLAKNGYLMIDMTPCIGELEHVLIDNPNQPALQVKANLVEELTVQIKNGRLYRYVQLPRKSLYIIIRQRQFQKTPDSDPLLEKDESADYMIKVRHNLRMYVQNTEYYLPNQGKMSMSQLKGADGFTLKWGQLFWSDTRGGVHHGERVNYTVVASKDPRARLDSQCVMRKEVSAKFVMAQFETANRNTFIFKTPVAGEKYYVNVIARVQSPEEDEAELIPYQPIELYIPEKTFLSKFVLCKYLSLFLFVIQQCLQ